MQNEEGRKMKIVDKSTVKIAKKTAKKITVLILIAMLLHGCASEKLNNGGNLSPDAQLGKDTQQEHETTLLPGQESEQDNGQTTGSPDSLGDSSDENRNQSNENGDPDALTDPEKQVPPVIDLNEVKPNEAGRIMVVMFHNFIEKYEKGDKTYTTTFSEFEKLLDTLYTSGYRLISMSDYLTGNISVPAGCIPMVFTFDDGTSGQFNLIEENGTFKANPKSAVGILEEFNKTHPDFGVKGTFFVNLGNQTFGSVGTLKQRLEYLIGKGFELGNHTYSHINLKEDGKTAAIIQKEIGKNQQKMHELIPGYDFVAFSLPYGAPAKELTQYVIKGEFEGTRYENPAIMEVGWDPAPSPFSIKFDPYSTHRVRSSGITPVDQDLSWWLSNMKRDNQYVSDGNPDTVAIPKSYLDYVNHEMIGDRTLLTY
jgi:peptidoglycan/xylan/chitin deacetylase (PgdA/CDA1 family)